MDPKSIQSIWNAFQEVQEAKHKKKEALDPVGKEDDDVDNDGDTDSSDEYLKKRRKAVGKSMDKDDVKEGELPPALKKNAEKKKKEGDKEDKDEVEEWVGKEGARRVSGGDKRKTKGLEEKEVKEEDKEECPKCEGEGCDHCDGKGYHSAKKETYSKKKMKESSLFSEEELDAIEEKAKQPNDTGTAAEPFMSTNSAGEKKFYADHQKSDKKFEDMEDVSEKDGSDAGKAVKSQSPTRRGEKRTGDIAMPTPTKAKGQ